MNDKKIAVIICINNETYYRECIFYLNRLVIPEGFSLEVFAISKANSIFEAYNQAMNQSDAKYKVYMHQDVFLIEKNILSRCIDFFKNHKNVGMIGVLGGHSVPENRRFYRSWNIGYVLACSEKKAYYNDLGRKTQVAKAIDGMFMMTQYDLPWREDILTGWDFYDFSQSMEFGKAGYGVWVMGGESALAFHDCGYLNLCRYDESLDAFLKEYGKDFPNYYQLSKVYPPEYQNQFAIRLEMMEGWKKLLFMGQEEEVRRLFQKVDDERFYNTEMAILKNILEIMQEERKNGIEKNFLIDCNNFDCAYKKYQNVKFYLRREIYASDDLGICPAVSNVAKKIIKRHCIPN